jgi:hypothetical protein
VKKRKERTQELAAAGRRCIASMLKSLDFIFVKKRREERRGEERRVKHELRENESSRELLPDFDASFIGCLPHWKVACSIYLQK